MKNSDKNTPSNFERATKDLSKNLSIKCLDNPDDRRWEIVNAIEWLTGLNRPDNDFDFLLSKICKKGALLEICELLVILEQRELLKTEKFSQS